ncbi:phosphate ABC transporter permease [Thermosipho melanesiensis]|uniref:Binding-protein-dependent transport systems inner membrane component n=2 Tax=Thermosipho melanesiensis TaxID=46541 RepID=A6LP12_THEM4|nr:ABC transporter permease subunit [Thermosipho melanesiensis]ABR31663.1 binding-protein-dependent transport systems inner membrane component [Thermosipho melanesiensis BI429]APT74690.1 phosphate ABC transporter permease [Thermosipho melanesiensis]OOC35187.1 phosphate ABC transporter permease [Thermosipho melanesiensis]OOC35397.1 phosphate ABC transporter permease [Thermosipho melanesiensis]OOC36648.1 phosphate ABC transporter permease [Thermosipho melanesiensis]
MRNFKYYFQLSLIYIFALISIAALFFLIYFVVKEAFPAIITLKLKPFTSVYWYPTYEPPEFGMLSLIVGTLFLTIFSSLITIPLGYLISFYLHAYSKKREKILIKYIISVLSGIPSVVIGAAILMYISPILLDMGIWTTENFLLATLGLSLLALPYSVTLMAESLDSVAIELEESALALGASKFITTLKITTKSSINGIINAIILTFNRIIGETMVVLLVGGGAAIIPRSLFDPVKPLTAAIASEIGEAGVGSMHYHSLFLAGLILLIISLLLTYYAKKRGRLNG